MGHRNLLRSSKRGGARPLTSLRRRPDGSGNYLSSLRTTSAASVGKVPGTPATRKRAQKTRPGSPGSVPGSPDGELPRIVLARCARRGIPTFPGRSGAQAGDLTDLRPLRTGGPCAGDVLGQVEMRLMRDRDPHQ